MRSNVDLTLDRRGLAYLKLEQYENAIADYDAALRISPRLPQSLNGRGIAKYKKGDAVGGDADIEAAKSIRADITEEFARYGVKY